MSQLPASDSLSTACMSYVGSLRLLFCAGEQMEGSVNCTSTVLDFEVSLLRVTGTGAELKSRKPSSVSLFKTNVKHESLPKCDIGLPICPWDMLIQYPFQVSKQKPM